MMAARDTGIVNIHGKQYETVALRVQKFREEHGDKYSLITELVERSDSDVVMRALIQDAEGRVIATGYAEEKRAASQINRTSALENCETSAIGRALAAFGLGGSEYATADEVANAISQQSSEPAPKSRPAATGGDQATPKQLKYIATLFTQQGVDEREERHARIEKILGHEIGSATQLTKAEAKKVIDQLLPEEEATQ